MLGIEGIVVPDLEVVSLEGHSSSAVHSSLKLESNSIGKWISNLFVSLLVNVEGLILSIVASVPDQVVVVMVSVSKDIEASNSEISDVSSSSTKESNLLSLLVFEWSNNGIIELIAPVGTSDSEDQVSVSESSDSSSSPVEDEPLLDVEWVVVSDSKSVHSPSESFSSENWSVTLHS